MSERLFLQGRVWATDYYQAVVAVREKVREKGYELTASADPKPSPPQVRDGIMWWEWCAEVKER